MTTDIRLRISSDLQKRFPSITSGGFTVEGLSRVRDVDFPSYDEIRAALADEAVVLDTIANEPRIAGWRSAIQSSGAKAAKVRGSAEQLVRRVLRGGDINAWPLIDLYCRCSARYLAPLGGYDLDRLPSTTIDLRHAAAGDSFEPLGGDASDMPLAPTIPVYAIGDMVICWMFNVRDSARTSLTPVTERSLFLTEALTPVQASASNDALTALREAFERAGATVSDIQWTNGMGEMTLAHRG